jgi:preprotein translocase subunit SecB
MAKKKRGNDSDNQAPKAGNLPEADAPDTGAAPYTIIAQYLSDLSFENPVASEVILAGGGLPEMDINIGMDARKLVESKRPNMYEVIVNVRAEAKRDERLIFIAELQYGALVQINEEVPEENHHPTLFIEIPRATFPYARQILSAVTQQGGYPPLMLNPVNFYALYMQRFGKEIEAAMKEREKIVGDLREDVKNKT